MTANAPPSAVNSPLTFSAEDTYLGLGKVEMRMRSLTDINHESVSLAHEAVCYHLESGGRRSRAVIGLEGGNALGIQQVDSVALAACAELLHNASLIHDDLQDRSLERRERVAVWSKFSLADERADAGGDGQPRCLNAVAVLRDSGCRQPHAVAREEAMAALRKAFEAASTLPRRSGSPLLDCVEATHTKLALAMP